MTSVSFLVASMTLASLATTSRDDHILCVSMLVSSPQPTVSNMIPMIRTVTTFLFVLLIPTACIAFAGRSHASHFGVRTIQSSAQRSQILTVSSTSTDTSESSPSTDDLLQPSYDVEKIPLRIGHGFDIHRMVPYDVAGQPIVIGGVEITHSPQKWTDATGEYCGTPNGIYETNLGVLAHSDGDVIYHSIVDAIFGALTLPDIGQVFQDTDPRWRGCDSSKFMEHATTVMKRYGYKIGNIDVTLILERPKVASFKPAMKDNIVRLLDTAPGRVNIKARTHERVDSVGELRSLSCHVVLTLELDNN